MLYYIYTHVFGSLSSFFFQNRTPMPSFGPLNKFAQDEKVEVEHVLEQCELCLGELSTFGFFLVFDFSGVKEKRFDGFITRKLSFVFVNFQFLVGSPPHFLKIHPLFCG